MNGLTIAPEIELVTLLQGHDAPLIGKEHPALVMPYGVLPAVGLPLRVTQDPVSAVHYRRPNGITSPSQGFQDSSGPRHSIGLTHVAGDRRIDPWSGEALAIPKLDEVLRS